MKLSISFKPYRNLLNTDQQTNLQETYDWLTTCFHQFENQKKYYLIFPSVNFVTKIGENMR